MRNHPFFAETFENPNEVQIYNESYCIFENVAHHVTHALAHIRENQGRDDIYGVFTYMCSQQKSSLYFPVCLLAFCVYNANWDKGLYFGILFPSNNCNMM